MERLRDDVKPPRRYDSRGRQRRAREVRDAVVDTAQRLFIRDGYAAITIAAIASAAGVSVETIYKAFGGKPGLVQAIVEHGLAGEGPVPAELRSDRIRQTESDPRKILLAWGQFTMELAPRVAPILRLARDAAATDPEMAAVLQDINHQRLERMTVNARGLYEAGHLRSNMSIQHAADILWTYSAPELYELLVLQRGWSSRRFGSFVAQAMIAALLPGDGMVGQKA
jgi:AcrR family transcriptional regulator